MTTKSHETIAMFVTGVGISVLGGNAAEAVVAMLMVWAFSQKSAA